MAVVLGTALPFSSIAVERHQRREAVSFVRNLGGSVTFEKTPMKFRIDFVETVTRCAWDVLGETFALCANTIDLSGTDIGDKEFARLMEFRRGFSGARQIDLSFTNITDASLHELGASGMLKSS